MIKDKSQVTQNLDPQNSSIAGMGKEKEYTKVNCQSDTPAA